MKNLKFNLRGLSPGATLLEILISISILGIFLVTLLSALSVGSLSTNVTEVQGYANDLAQSQMEYVLNHSYLTPPATYPIISDIPPDYTVSAASVAIDGNDTVSRVTVTVSRLSRVLITLDNIKASP